MDTKSKSRHKLRAGVAVLLLAAIAAGFVAAFPFFYKRSQVGAVGYFDRPEFAETLYKSGYVQFWNLARLEDYQKRQQQKQMGREELSPGLSCAEVFYPLTARSLQRQVRNGDAQAEWLLAELDSACRQVIEDWERDFNYAWSDHKVLVQREGADEPLSVGSKDLAELLQSVEREIDVGEETSQMLLSAPFCAVLEYGEDGSVAPKLVKGAEGASLGSRVEGRPYYTFEDAVRGYAGPELAQSLSLELEEAARPSHMTAAYLIKPTAPGAYNRFEREGEYYKLRGVTQAGFTQLYLAALGAAGLLGLGAVLLDRKERAWPARIPPELAVFLGGIPFALSELLAWRLLAAAEGRPLIQFGVQVPGDLLTFPPAGHYSTVAGYILSGLILLGLMLCVYAAAYSAGQVRWTGLIGYLTQRSLTVRALMWCGRGLRNLAREATAIDLTQPKERTALKIVALNLLIVAGLCCLWFFGILGALAYSLGLYLLLRRRMGEIQGQYRELLTVTGEMAQGRLDASFQGELGLFAPLGRQLEQVQEGFRRAVEEEVKSRSMKTELVANVSHDLKTPLTAIITYVGLLQEEGISEEERRSYIETLDNKSQRLKTIIDDLFEMSRVSTGNVTLERVPVDLLALIRQVELELQREIQDSGIEFRHRFSQERAMALLDGGKTSRIFQNLFVNVTKYGMPGTRAYVDVAVRGGSIVTKVSNVSREPLELEGDLTERFVRGDRSRNTEGSGLGLAIARSLTELQGGRMAVSAEGDLFKVVVLFPLEQGGEEPPELPEALPEIQALGPF